MGLEHIYEAMHHPVLVKFLKGCVRGGLLRSPWCLHSVSGADAVIGTDVAFSSHQADYGEHHPAGEGEAGAR
jgi:hypothetical protein